MTTHALIANPMPAELRPVVCVTQARLSSFRLPAKVLKPILGKPLLWWHLERLKQATLVDQVVVAIADDPDAHLLVEIADQVGLPSVVGPQDDVLERFRLAVDKAGAGSMIRVTSDCPLIDPALIDATIRRFAASHAPGSARPLDYLSIDVSRLPRGLDVEMLTRAQFELMAGEAREQHDREHVTCFTWQRPERFVVEHWAPEGADYGHLRLCVDLPEDLARVNAISVAALGTLDVAHQALPPNWCFGWQEAVALAAARQAAGEYTAGQHG